jgi:glucose-6-phosphate isomerase
LAKPIEKALASHQHDIAVSADIDAVTAARINLLNS